MVLGWSAGPSLVQEVGMAPWIESCWRSEFRPKDGVGQCRMAVFTSLCRPLWIPHPCHSHLLILSLL